MRLLDRVADHFSVQLLFCSFWAPFIRFLICFLYLWALQRHLDLIGNHFTDCLINLWSPENLHDGGKVGFYLYLVYVILFVFSDLTVKLHYKLNNYCMSLSTENIEPDKLLKNNMCLGVVSAAETVGDGVVSGRLQQLFTLCSKRKITGPKSTFRKWGIMEVP